jgi:hypothetical protein
MSHIYKNIVRRNEYVKKLQLPNQAVSKTIFYM